MSSLRAVASDVSSNSQAEVLTRRANIFHTNAYFRARAVADAAPVMMHDK